MTQVVKECALQAQKILYKADQEIVFQTGSAQIVMKKNGDILLKGKNISIKGSRKISTKASSDVIVKGSSIKEN